MSSTSPAHASSLAQIVFRVISGTDIENRVQLLQGAFLRLRQAEPSEDEPKQVPGCIPGKCALRSEGSDEFWPCQRQNEVEAPASSSGERHASVADSEGVCFGGIGEGYRTHTGRVADHEEVDTGGHTSKSCCAASLGNPKGKAGEEQANSHVWESCEQEPATALRVNSHHARDSKQPVFL